MSRICCTYVIYAHMYGTLTRTCIMLCVLVLTHVFSYAIVVLPITRILGEFSWISSNNVLCHHYVNTLPMSCHYVLWWMKFIRHHNKDHLVVAKLIIYVRWVISHKVCSIFGACHDDMHSCSLKLVLELLLDKEITWWSLVIVYGPSCPCFFTIWCCRTSLSVFCWLH